MSPVLALFWLAAVPEQRAIDYLAREVERWPRENHCYSCHNNGDGARVLFRAAPGIALAGTREWLSHPGNWEKGGGNPGFNNATLARIQFAAALAEMGGNLRAAAELVARDQKPDGRWEIDTGGLPGAPATYGTALATYMARRTLERAGRFADAIRRADRWFEKAEPNSITDAAAILLARPRSKTVRSRCLPTILGAQTSDGGWGPQRGAPAEIFDTALVLLALQAAAERGPIERGRAYLLARQESYGGWQETTRPTGNTSYAEHISTTAWALEALLATNPKRQ